MLWLLVEVTTDVFHEKLVTTVRKLSNS